MQTLNDVKTEINILQIPSNRLPRTYSEMSIKEKRRGQPLERAEVNKANLGMTMEIENKMSQDQTNDPVTHAAAAAVETFH